MPTNDWITDLIDDLANAFGNANDPCAKAALASLIPAVAEELGIVLSPLLLARIEGKAAAIFPFQGPAAQCGRQSREKATALF